MVYQIGYEGGLWYADNQSFPSELAAIQHLRELTGREGKIVTVAKDRIEVHFEDLSRFPSQAGST
jgi:hypothetical protein